MNKRQGALNQENAVSYHWRVDGIIDFLDNPLKNSSVDSFNKRIPHVDGLFRNERRDDHFTTCEC